MPSGVPNEAYQADDDRLLTRREAREHRREVGGMLDEMRRLWSEVQKVRAAIDAFSAKNGVITIDTNKLKE